MTAFPYLVPTQHEMVAEGRSSAGDSQRLTLIARQGEPSRGLTHSARVVTIDALGFLLRASVDGVLPLDIERVVFDWSADVKHFLDFLASLPLEFSGDVLLICEEGGAYLSSSGRGSGRLLHLLNADDLDFYLTTSGLTNEPHLEGWKEHVRASANHRS